MLHNSAYTLLEVILALALTTVILGLIGMSIHVHLGVADKSRGQVEEAQLARTLLQRIAEDLRNSIPYSPTAAASGTATGSTTSTAGTTAGTASGTASGSTDSDDSPTTSETIVPSGVSGSIQCLQMDTSRRVRPVGATQDAGGETVTPLATLSDVKTVTYSLGDLGASTAAQQGDAATGTQSGLYRRELERSAYACAIQQGQSDTLNQATALLAPEVVDLRFTYYDGTTTSDEWDSSVQGKLPSAVKITIMLRRVSAKATPQPLPATTDNSKLAVYDMLVELPNAKVQASSTPAAAGGTGTTQ